MVLKDDILKYAGELEDTSSREEKGMVIYSRGERVFLVIEPETNPLRVQIRCDRRLSRTLQERYESVMESRALGRNGIEIICSGQLAEDEIIDLVRHSYEVSAPVEE